MRDSRCPDYPNECFHPFHAKAAREVPATNDPKPPVCDNCGSVMAEDGYYGSPIWWCPKCRRSIPRRAEVPAGEGMLAAALMNHIYTPGGLCACGHSYPRVVSHAAVVKHVAEALEPLFVAGLQKARDEGEVTGRIRAAQSAIGFIQEHPKASATDLDAHLAKVFGEPSREQLDRAAGPS